MLHLSRPAIALISLLAQAAPPLRTPPPAPTPPPPSSCTASITGAAGVLSGSTYPCTPRVVYDPTKHLTVFTLTLSTPGSGSVVQLNVSVAAPQITPRADTFTLGAGNVTGTATLKETAGLTAPVWAAFTSESEASAPVGQATLELKALGPTTATTGRQIYPNPEGALSATLQPQDGTPANGVVAIQLTFQPQPNQ
jgi:hypothetical protein